MSRESSSAAPRRLRWLSPTLAAGGLLASGYLLGAAVMHFGLPTSDALAKGFLGARAWRERAQALEAMPPAASVHAGTSGVDRPEATCDGFTLCAFTSMAARQNTQAVLLDMHRRVVHRWAVPFSRVWPRPPHLTTRIDDELVCFFDCHPYPNGELLVVFHGLQAAGAGYGLAKLDRDSNVLWGYAAPVHHDVDVGTDGAIYAIKQEVAKSMPAGLAFVQAPALVDALVVLNPDGTERLPPLPVLEALRDSPYAPLLHTAVRARIPPEPGRPGDPLHTNCVRVLRAELAPHFPMFRAGQVLVSIRELDALAVFDLETRKVVWASRGPWKAQHDAQFLPGGRLLLFDNLGSPHGSRVLEYDPRTQALPWCYPGPDDGRIFTAERGMCQRLPNGNTLVVISQGKEVREIDRGGQIVWSSTFDAFVCCARRYRAAQLPFVKGEPRERP